MADDSESTGDEFGGDFRTTSTWLYKISVGQRSRKVRALLCSIKCRFHPSMCSSQIEASRPVTSSQVQSYTRRICTNYAMEERQTPLQTSPTHM